MNSDNHKQNKQKADTIIPIQTFRLKSKNIGGLSVTELSQSVDDSSKTFCNWTIATIHRMCASNEKRKFYPPA